MAFNSALYSKLVYDPLRDFVPVALVYKFGYVMVGRKDMPQKALQDIVAAAKANLGSISVATAGVGTGQQLVAAAFMKAAGVKLLEVPYKGSPPAFTDLLAGRIDLFFDSMAAGLPYVQSGQARDIAVLSSKRSPLAPDVPTMAEAGVPGLDVDSWLGIFAPAKTPPGVVAKLRTDTVRVNTPDDKFNIMPLDGAKWYYHPDGDDIAVCPIGINTTHHKIRSVQSHSFLTKTMIEQYDVGVGDDTFVVGRFISREGKARNIPSVRFGAIAQMPAEPIVLDGGIAQESYLIEARSIPGYSGSPVFLTIPPAPAYSPSVNPNLPEEMKAHIPELLKMIGYNPKRTTQFQLGPWLVGIDYCHIYDKELIFNNETGKPVENIHVRSNTGMMGVIPAWRLADILEGPGIMSIVDNLKAAVERGKEISE